MEETKQYPLDTLPPKPRVFWTVKRTTLVFLILFASMFSIFRLIAYGSVFRSCEYSEKALEIPLEMSSAEIIFTKDIRQAEGKIPFYGGCLRHIGKIKRTILPLDRINESMILPQYHGMKISSIPARSRIYRIKEWYLVENHGISTFPNGPSKLYQLILEDQAGEKYHIPVVYLEENGAEYDERSIAVARINGKEYPLSSMDFRGSFDGFRVESQ